MTSGVRGKKAQSFVLITLRQIKVSNLRGFENKCVTFSSYLLRLFVCAQGGKEYIMRAHFGLPSVESDELEARRPITVNFEIPYFTVSGIQVGTFNHQPADLIPLLCFTNASFHIHTRLRCCIDGNVNVMLIIDFK